MAAPNRFSTAPSPDGPALSAISSSMIGISGETAGKEVAKERKTELEIIRVAEDEEGAELRLENPEEEDVSLAAVVKRSHFLF